MKSRSAANVYDDDYVQYLDDNQSLRAIWPVDDHHALETMTSLDDAPSAENMDD